VFGLAAATCSPALAESGAPALSMPALPDLAAAAAAVLDDATLAEVMPADMGLPELEPVAKAAPTNILPAVPAQKAAAEPVTTGAAAAPPPEPVPEPSAAPEPDIPAPDAPPAAVEQDSPANINVSVRVDSPGDNGAVDQANTAEASLEGVTQYQPDAPRYQEPIPANEVTPSAAGADSSTPADAAGWDWNWSWNCVDPVPEIPASPNGSVQNWTWNWDWDCGVPELPEGNTRAQSGAQYQPVVTQYRPININVSIRINSAGNDGPVRQTNAAAASTSTTTTFVIPTIRVALSDSPGSPVAGPAMVVSAFAAEPFFAAAPAAVFEALVDETTELEECCLPHRRQPIRFAVPTAERNPVAPAPDALPREATAPARFEEGVAITLQLTQASQRAAHAARTAPLRARTVRPAPRHRPAEAAGEPARTLASGFAPADASDSRIGSVMLALVGFALFFAFADATRSVAADVRAAGEDPDPPPDRPG
jgi:hypothetical protein